MGRTNAERGGFGLAFEDDGGENHKRDDEDDGHDEEEVGWQNWGAVEAFACLSIRLTMTNPPI